MRPLLTRTARVLAGGVLAVALAACSDDDSDIAGDDSTVDSSSGAGETVTTDPSATEGTVAEGYEATCEALRPISEHDVATGPLIEAGEWDAIQSFLVDSEEEVVGAYEQTAELAPELSDDLLVLRDLTRDYTAAAADAPDLASWIGEVTSLVSEHPEANQAALDLDGWAVEHCGFSTGGN